MLGAGFSQKTLTDNWYEDRLHPKSSDSELEKVIRSDDDVKAGRQIRWKKPPTGAIADDGFERYDISVTHEKFVDPSTIPSAIFNNAGTPHFITSETVAEVCYEKRRPLNDVPQRGFRCIVDRHPPGYRDVSWHTAFTEAHETLNDPATFAKRKSELRGKPAGVPSFRDLQPPAQALVGENAELCDIPTQRAWMNQDDPGLREYTKSKGAAHKLPEKDNELSLPLGEGCQRKIMEAIAARGGKAYYCYCLEPQLHGFLISEFFLTFSSPTRISLLVCFSFTTKTNKASGRRPALPLAKAGKIKFRYGTTTRTRR
ncbi:unnamed protein product [Amoebophrya sp. A25]|nr:unnamed protein product [Amoebophrya sp. A25]|eukprot:GSA25T00002161001.1